MSYITVEVEIDHGKVVANEPDKLPVIGKGLLTILPATAPKQTSHQIEFPLIVGDGSRTINPTSEELDASLWD